MKFSFEVLSGHVRRDEGVRTTAQDIAASDSMKQPLPRFHGIARGKILAFAVGLGIIRFFLTLRSISVFASIRGHIIWAEANSGYS